MAELNLGKGLTAGKVASNVQKKLTRAQEKVLQKLGKADETKDVAFEEGVINFNKQYTEGSKLQRDLRAYLEAVKAMHESSKNVQACLADMYEPEWYGSREVESIVEDCDVLWEDYHQKLVDHALISMDTYLGQFPDIKARIAKRDRKLVDYDSARHNYATTHKTKKKDGGIKLTKPSSLLERATPGWAQGILSAHNVAQSSLSRSQAEEELERAQKVFEEINIDLQEELPSLWNSRVGFYVSTFQSLAGFEEKFHKEIGRLDQDLYDVLEKLERTGTSGGKEASNHTLRPGGPPPIPKSPSKLRPAMPPPPKVTPSMDMKAENIVNLFDAAANPDISVTSPTEFDSPAVSNLLDMDLDSFSEATKTSTVTQPANWDSWPEDSGDQEEETQQHYDPVAAATDAWGDDGTQPVRYDPIAAATEGWGDDGTQPVCYDEEEEVDDGSQQAHYDPAAEDQNDWADDGAGQSVTEVPDEEPAAEAPAEEEATSAAAALDEEEGQGESAAAAAAATAAEEEEVTEETPAAAAAAPEAAAAAAPAAAAASAESTEAASEEAEMPAGFLFKLQVMHDYAANDTDELEMKAGDVVLVIPFDNAEEQDDGWLMGMKEDDWHQNKENAAKGVFPENFTQRL
ncbi:myc box-dependent-interacting protein 1 isoform X5 [Labrus mixtus]|uniref:myc box-dependent-interacting protein 1 isoform X5 n=1 Tax=Labrus mixtus TaxID=508554 RepID=UPI0029C00175|nr:myc box-dependent-interacting protein 1 isoform X5 [Labrus mixtus]